MDESGEVLNLNEGAGYLQCPSMPMLVMHVGHVRV